LKGFLAKAKPKKEKEVKININRKAYAGQGIEELKRGMASEVTTTSPFAPSREKHGTNWEKRPCDKTRTKKVDDLTGEY